VGLFVGTTLVLFSFLMNKFYCLYFFPHFFSLEEIKKKEKRYSIGRRFLLFVVLIFEVYELFSFFMVGLGFWGVWGGWKAMFMALPYIYICFLRFTNVIFSPCI